MKPSCIHPTADVKSPVGQGSRIYAFVTVSPGVEVGTEVTIANFCFLEEGTSVGNRVTLKTGVSLWKGIHLEDDVFIGPNVVFGNDRYPRSGNRNFVLQETRISTGASIGGNATILPGVTVGSYAMVAAGSVVTNDVPEQGLVMGIPAQLVGKVCRCGKRIHAEKNEWCETCKNEKEKT